MENQELLNLSYDQLVQKIDELGEKPYRATQNFEWVYQKGAGSFAAMKNIPKGLRKQLARDFSSASLEIIKKEISKDGTTKILFELDDRENVETVLIPTATRTTVCVSTQAGCKFGCRFCASGIGGWRRNLTVAEILAQILHVKEESKKHKKILSHVVFMGIGESLSIVRYDAF